MKNATLLRRRAGPTCLVSLIMGLIVTLVILTDHVGVQHSTCKFTMSSELSEDVAAIHNEFKRCVFNATQHNGLKIQQLTAVRDKNASFEIYVDLTLPADWSLENAASHVRHLFTKSTCKYAFHGNCLLNGTRVALR